jgi:S-DNA-T family DNA segregation ATPase FtsK/SpoIIIE
MVDPKTVEFKDYERLPHLLVPVINDNNKTSAALRGTVIEMEKRFKIFKEANVRNIIEYNNRKIYTQTDMFGDEEDNSKSSTMPYIIVIIDEVADLMAACGNEVTLPISRLAAKARAAGIHLILATQRPDAKVINGTIKSNIPGRIAFKTSSSIDSRTILDGTGAESLIGKGDMLYRTPENSYIRAQGAYISPDEISNITNYISERYSMRLDEKFTNKLAKVKETDLESEFNDEEDSPEEQPPKGRAAVLAAQKASNLKKALEIVINEKRMSISFLQQCLSIGYNNAAKICMELQKMGVIGPQHGAGPRPILMNDEELMALFNSLPDEGGEQTSLTGEDSIAVTEQPLVNGELL